MRPSQVKFVNTDDYIAKQRAGMAQLREEYDAARTAYLLVATDVPPTGAAVQAAEVMSRARKQLEAQVEFCNPKALA